jgi:hypothetical protein
MSTGYDKYIMWILFLASFVVLGIGIFGTANERRECDILKFTITPGEACTSEAQTTCSDPKSCANCVFPAVGEVCGPQAPETTIQAPWTYPPSIATETPA